MNPLETVRGFPRKLRETAILAWYGLRAWDTKRFLVAGASAAGMLLLVGLVTVLIPNSWFSREIPPIWWNYPVWIVTSIFSGMLLAGYLRSPGETAMEGTGPESQDERNGRWGFAGGLLAWFAVGCPVCNKIAVLVLGYTGAITWFAPLQPWLAVAAMLLTGGALLVRLKGQVSCRIAPTRANVGA